MNMPVNTFQDIIDALENNPQLREELRRHLLDQEFLQLPLLVQTILDTLKQFMEMTNQRLTLLEGRQDRMEARQDRMENDIQEIKSSIRDIYGRFDKIDERMDRMDGRMDKMDGRMDNGFGANYEARVSGNIGSIAGQALRLRRVKTLKSINVPRDPDLDVITEQAETDGLITEAEYYDLWLLDLIFSGLDSPERNTALVAAEVSITAGNEDINRAANRADILKKATENVNVIPAVIAANIDQERQSLANSLGVTVITFPEN